MQVTVLVENTARGAGVLGEHGLSWCLQHAVYQLLFDLGQGVVIGANSDRLGIDLASTDVVVFSHGHYDHVGGWKHCSKVLGAVSVYLHPDALGGKFQKHADGRVVSAEDRDFANVLQTSGARLMVRRDPTELLPGVWMTGEVPRLNAIEDTGGDFYTNRDGEHEDILLDDQSIFFRTTRGVVVILGCAHAGLINTLEYVKKLTGERIHAAVGGMHLLHANEARMEFTVDALQHFAPDWLEPVVVKGGQDGEAL